MTDHGAWKPERPTEFDHSRPRALGGRTHKENGRALCIPCHRSKTQQDISRIAEAIRKGGGPGSQYHRQKMRKAKGEHALIRSRGFDKR